MESEPRTKFYSASLQGNARPQPATWIVALICFANLFVVGTVYGLDVLQFQLPRITGIPTQWQFLPFGGASFGLSLGTGFCPLLISYLGARTTAATGTLLWGLCIMCMGHAISSESFNGVLWSCIAGGIGVGITYLAIIATARQSLSQAPLIAGAIGPLGFSSGTALCFIISTSWRFDTLDSVQLGGICVVASLPALAVGALTLILLPAGSPVRPAGASSDQAKNNTFSTILFFNSLMGMTAMDAVLLLTDHHGENSADSRDLKGLAYSMVFLALGGLLAQRLRAWLGTKRIFLVMFGLRGAFLVAQSRRSDNNIAAVTFWILLFGHGVGFSLMPSLVGATCSGPNEFVADYGKTLTSWGASGVIGCVLNIVMTSTTGQASRTGEFLGVITLSFAAYLAFVEGTLA